MSVKKSFITVPLEKLVPYGNNPRDNAPAVPDTVQSIKECENLDPIEVDEGFVILSGHTRLLALQQLGYKETEVVQYEGLTEEQKRKYRILANKTNELADWDFDKLDEELTDLDFSNFDFDFDRIEGGSYLDAMEEKFGTQGEATDSDFTVVSLTFDKTDGEEVRSFIKRNDQDGIVQTILNYIRGI